MEPYILITLLIWCHHLSANPLPFDPVISTSPSGTSQSTASPSEYVITPQPGSGDDDNDEEDVVDMEDTDKTTGCPSNTAEAAKKIHALKNKLAKIFSTIKDAIPVAWVRIRSIIIIEVHFI